METMVLCETEEVVPPRGKIVRELGAQMYTQRVHILACVVSDQQKSTK
jgi:hypothetical protein